MNGVVMHGGGEVAGASLLHDVHGPTILHVAYCRVFVFYMETMIMQSLAWFWHNSLKILVKGMVTRSS